MSPATDATTRTDTHTVTPVVHQPAHAWKEVQGLDSQSARELLCHLKASGCKRRQFAINGRDGTYVVRWV